MCVINFDKLVRFWMKRMAVLLIVLLPLPAFAAGTWDHRMVKTLNDGSVLVEFTRQSTGEVRVVHFSRVIGNGLDQLSRKKWNLEVAWSVLNSFDLGENSREILVKLIKARFDVDYHVSSVERLLHSLGFSHVSARPRHPKQDPETIETFKKTSRRYWRRA